MTRFRRIQPPVFPFDARIEVPVKLLTLRNGTSVFLIEAGTEDIMRIEFVFRAGMVQEYLPLLATSANMMLTEGSEKYSAEELNGILDYYGIFLNMTADKDNAGLIVYFLNKHFEKVLELLVEILFRPKFHEKELGILMNKRLNWYRINREKVQNIAGDRFFESVFGSHHPYGRQVQEADFGAMVPSLLKDFHAKFYKPEKMTMIVSGRIPDNAADSFEKYFGGLSSKEIYTEDSKNKIIGAPGRKEHIRKKGAIQTAIRIGSTAINKRHADYPGLKFLNVLLGGYFGSRLMKNIREEKGFTYGIHSSVSSFDLSGFILISTEVGKKNAKQAVDEIYKEIHLLRTKPVGRDELEVVRNYMSGEMVRMFDGPFAIAESFKAAWEFGLDFNYFIRLMNTIRTITPDEISRLAAKYYNPDDLYEITVG
ncbi:MAG: insulinase family protein [Bacteroidia bacterium]|nr:MAG: insulinase family protein [Bacteroidia bacterium]